MALDDAKKADKAVLRVHALQNKAKKMKERRKKEEMEGGRVGGRKGIVK